MGVTSMVGLISFSSRSGVECPVPCFMDDHSAFPSARPYAAPSRRNHVIKCFGGAVLFQAAPGDASTAPHSEPERCPSVEDKICPNGNMHSPALSSTTQIKKATLLDGMGLAAWVPCSTFACVAWSDGGDDPMLPLQANL